MAEMNDQNVPDMCTHSSRFSSITEFVRWDDKLGRYKVATFFTSKGFYWMLEDKDEKPNNQNSRGRLPQGFRGDAAFFRQWHRCEMQLEVKFIGQNYVCKPIRIINYLLQIVPMIVIVDNDETTFGWPVIRYLVYYIQEDKWADSQPALPISHDPALSRTKIYNGFKSVDTILNFGNVKTSWNALDDSLFIISTANNNSHYYDFIKLEGCVQSNGTFYIKELNNRFGGLLENAFWPMESPVDAAFVFLSYPKMPPYMRSHNADVILFQANANYQFSISMNLISEVSLNKGSKNSIPNDS